jgi:hypothetical protein
LFAAASIDVRYAFEATAGNVNKNFWFDSGVTWTTECGLFYPSPLRNEIQKKK